MPNDGPGKTTTGDAYRRPLSHAFCRFGERVPGRATAGQQRLYDTGWIAGLSMKRGDLPPASQTAQARGATLQPIIPIIPSGKEKWRWEPQSPRPRPRSRREFWHTTFGST